MSSTAFLGVETSLTGRRWVAPSADNERRAEALAQQTSYSLTLCRLLAARGVEAPEIADYLAPSLRNLLPDPRGLKDLPLAAERILKAADQSERIAVFADYDVDGACSGAELVIWLRQLGSDATIYVPDRIDEGYGPNIPAMATLAEAHDLIICVDCGTLSHDAIAAAKGVDVIVLDHHLASEVLPDAHSVVNPNRQDEDGALAHLCAAAVVFLTLVECNRQMREAGREGPDLMSLLDLVALATVADVASLTGVNRAFVVQGLKVLARRARPGLVALSDIAGIDRKPSGYHLGYVLGPRINAGGRVGQADLGIRLLTARSQSDAAAIAAELDRQNAERRQIENQVRDAALAQAEARDLTAPLVWAAGEGWHPGVVGIVASRLKEKTNRPAIVIGLQDGIGKGSGRSVSGVDLGAAIQRLSAEGVLLKGGGHKMAAGLTIDATRLEEAMARLSDLLARQGAGTAGPADLKLTGMLMAAAASVDMIEELEAAGPFGAGAPAPRFAFPNQRIRSARQVGQNHLKISFGDESGGRLDAICFGAFDSALGTALDSAGHRLVHLAGRLEINEWGGRSSPQLQLEDAAFADETESFSA